MIKSTLLGLCLLLATQMTAAAQDMSNDVTVPFFGNTICPVSGKPTKPKFSVQHGAEKIFVCCKTCLAKVKSAPKAYQAKAYPPSKLVDVKNAKCPIMGGKAKATVTSTFQGHRIRYCCPGCDKKFLKEPNKHLARLTAKQKLAELGNKVCPVMTDKAVTTDSFLIYKGQIVNTCCGGCAERFSKNPEKSIEALKKMDKSKPSKRNLQRGGDQAP